ncbi:BZIP transcription factor [Penicillium ucsense]|uniref:BZIP transcription factor n=1 Tax=Penicillium ucsense TaxID=2839758 RepID=A0A8J8W193_9EURO|nr:BZIP transcription factor [Penicillium ucsense]KAF7735765.1 BZIP transcription factor [Penicillium ucsense]
MLRNDRLSEFEARSPIDDRSPTEKVLSSPRHSAHRPPLRARPQTWHPYVPVEPPVDISSSRSIGVHAILNPPVRGMTPLEKPIRRERTSRASMSSTSARSAIRPRQGSSPAPRSSMSLASQPLSPGSLQRSGRIPESPSSYYSTPVGMTASARSKTAQSPFLSQEPPVNFGQQQQQQVPLPSLVGSPISHDAALRPLASSPVLQPLTRNSLNSPSNVLSRHMSTGPTPRAHPHSLEESPSTPQSIFSHLGHVSPVVAGVPISSCTATSSTPAPSNYPRPDLIDRAMSSIVVPHSNLPDEKPGTQAMIPCLLDLKSGSSTQAEKRKANSDASRRFRNRKRNEMQLEQRLNAQQDEIQRHAETIRHQAEEIRFLLSQRDHYRAERNFFREAFERLDGAKYSLQRPSSPRPIHLNTVSGMDTPKSGTASSPTSVKREPAPMRLLESVRSQSEWAASDASSTFSSPAGPITGSSGPHHPPPLHYPSQSSTGDVSPRTNPASMAGVSLAPLQKPWSRS